MFENVMNTIEKLMPTFVLGTAMFLFFRFSWHFDRILRVIGAVLVGLTLCANYQKSLAQDEANAQFRQIIESQFAGKTPKELNSMDRIEIKQDGKNIYFVCHPEHILADTVTFRGFEEHGKVVIANEIVPPKKESGESNGFNPLWLVLVSLIVHTVVRRDC